MACFQLVNPSGSVMEMIFTAWTMYHILPYYIMITISILTRRLVFWMDDELSLFLLTIPVWYAVMYIQIIKRFRYQGGIEVLEPARDSPKYRRAEGVYKKLITFGMMISTLTRSMLHFQPFFYIAVLTAVIQYIVFIAALSRRHWIFPTIAWSVIPVVAADYIFFALKVSPRSEAWGVAGYGLVSCGLLVSAMTALESQVDAASFLASIGAVCLVASDMAVVSQRWVFTEPEYELRFKTLIDLCYYFGQLNLALSVDANRRI